MKKWKQLKKTILASTMVVAMVAIMGMPILATGLQTGTAGTITKILEVPQGVETPAKTFRYTFTKVGIRNAAGVAVSATEQPTIDNKDIVFTAGFAQTAGTVIGYNNSTNTNAAILTGITWPHAGEYVYTVAEVDNSGTDSSVTFSKATYEMTVYVKNVDLSVNNDVVVTNVGFRKITNDDGTPVAAVVGGVDDGKQPKADPIFTNRYKKFVKLDISKKVAGAFADTTKDFTFTPSFVRPVDTTAVTSVGTVIGADGVATTRTVTVTFAANSTVGSITTVPATAEGTFTLKHGEKIVFEGVNSSLDTFQKGNLPAGTIWTIAETGAPGYTATAVVNNNDGAGTAVLGGTAGDNLSISEVPVGTNLVAGEKTNAAAFTNTYQDITPTGVLINNLPYILLIVVAMAGFTGYIVSKRRKNAR